MVDTDIEQTNPIILQTRVLLFQGGLVHVVVVYPNGLVMAHILDQVVHHMEELVVRSCMATFVWVTHTSRSFYTDSPRFRLETLSYFMLFLTSAFVRSTALSAIWWDAVQYRAEFSFKTQAHIGNDSVDDLIYCVLPNVIVQCKVEDVCPSGCVPETCSGHDRYGCGGCINKMLGVCCQDVVVVAIVQRRIGHR